ncbi:DUF368 domain-containing protein, partial [Escherichia coli]
AESISYAHATLSTYLFSAIALAVGIALGYWMSALESKYK